MLGKDLKSVFGKVLFDNRKSYRRLEEADEELQESLLINSGRSGKADQSKETLDKFLHILRTVFSTLFIVSYIALGYLAWKKTPSQACKLGNEKIYSDVPVFYKETRFHRAGFHDTRHKSLTAFEGPPNEENNAAWDRLVKVGVVLISDNENSKIIDSTAATKSNPRQHIVEIEMFHQLHCLKWLRDEFWELSKAWETSTFPADIPQRTNHTDHCIDYLRQVIMCHGDLTPITFEWIPEITGHIAHYSTQHQCRNFEVIYKWAEGRRVPGLDANVNHVNI